MLYFMILCSYKLRTFHTVMKNMYHGSFCYFYSSKIAIAGVFKLLSDFLVFQIYTIFTILPELTERQFKS